MLQGEHSAILSTFIKLRFVIKIFVLSIFEWPLKKDFTVCALPFSLLYNGPRRGMCHIDTFLVLIRYHHRKIISFYAVFFCLFFHHALFVEKLMFQIGSK